jgi:hypothetical protein
MSRKQKRKQGANLKSGRFQRLRKAVHKARAFLSKRYVYSGLLGGFLWMFSAPFIITALLGLLDESSVWVIQLAFFPLMLSSLIIETIIADSVSYPRVWLIIFGFSFLISTLLGLSIAYSIHRLRARTKNRG